MRACLLKATPAFKTADYDSCTEWPKRGMDIGTYTLKAWEADGISVIFPKNFCRLKAGVFSDSIKRSLL